MISSYVAIRNLDFKTIGVPTIKKIYVNEHLSAYNAKLAYQCRLMLKSGLILSTKVVKGRIKIQMKNIQWVIIEHKNDKYVPEYGYKDI